MWVGMMPDSDPQKARMLNRFKPMATFTEKNGYPPEKVDVATGKAQGKGPVGFSAAMLPFLQNRDAQAVQRQRVVDNFPGSDAYYNYVLTLFGQGWDQHRFRFSTKGELLPDWGQGMRKFTLNIFTLSLGLVRHADGRGSTNRSATVAGASSVRRSDPS